jgi:hypothetical protein
MEQWKIISENNNYSISDMGNVKNNKRNILLKTYDNKGGYTIVSLCKDSKQKSYTVHRLVAKAFLVNPKNKEQVNHINNIRNDNRVKNLEWNTRKENMQHALKQGRMVFTSTKADDNGNSKLTWDIVNDIRTSELSKMKLSIKYNISLSHVYDLINNKYWVV